MKVAAFKAEPCPLWTVENGALWAVGFRDVMTQSPAAGRSAPENGGEVSPGDAAIDHLLAEVAARLAAAGVALAA
jgi:hypothetical protein